VAVEVYRRQLLFDQADAAFAAWRADPAAWAEEQAERAAWDATFADGIEELEWAGSRHAAKSGG
jgi:hypothetical protein